MAVELEIDLEGLDVVEENIDALIEGTTEAVEIGLLAAARMIVHRVAEDKLSGQVLNAVTAALRTSIQESPRSWTDGEDVFAAIGTHLDYGRAHELGFSGTVDVQGHTRDYRGTQVDVRPHQRRMNIEAKHFLRDGIEEASEDVARLVELSVMHLAEHGRHISPAALLTLVS